MSHNRVTEAILFGILFTQLQSCVTAGVNYKCGLGAEWCVCVCVKSACGVWIVCAPHISLPLSSLSRSHALVRYAAQTSYTGRVMAASAPTSHASDQVKLGLRCRPQLQAWPAATSAT